MTKTKTKKKAARVRKKAPPEPNPRGSDPTHYNAKPADQHHQHRINLMLDDKQKAVWDKMLTAVSERLGRHVHGTELVGVYVLPALRLAAKKLNMPLNPEQPLHGDELDKTVVRRLPSLLDLDKV